MKNTFKIIEISNDGAKLTYDDNYSSLSLALKVVDGYLKNDDDREVTYRIEDEIGNVYSDDGTLLS